MPSQDRFILWLDECDGQIVSSVGGKCAGLGELIKAGVAVPPGFAVTTHAHRAFLAHEGLAERISRLVGEANVDDAGSIGRRYRRQDEVGTPLCVTVDFDTLEDRQVTVRERDSMAQDRLPIENLVVYLDERLS